MNAHGSSIQRTARWFHLAVLLSATPAALAANLQVAPLRLSLEPEQRAISVSLNNTDAKPVVVEVKAYRWEQVDGVDKLTPTTDLVLTPPLAEVPGNGTQLIRVGRRATVKAGPLERTYRVMIQEVVPAAETARPGLHFALRLSLPLFIAPVLTGDAVARPKGEWTASVGPKGELLVAARNAGTVRMQVTALEVFDAEGKLLASHPEMSYVLAGQARRWPLKAAAALPANGATLTVKAKTDAGDQVARVAFSRP